MQNHLEYAKNFLEGLGYEKRRLISKDFVELVRLVTTAENVHPLTHWVLGSDLQKLVMNTIRKQRGTKYEREFFAKNVVIFKLEFIFRDVFRHNDSDAFDLGLARLRAELSEDALLNNKPFKNFYINIERFYRDLESGKDEVMSDVAKWPLWESVHQFLLRNDKTRQYLSYTVHSDDEFEEVEPTQP